MSTQESAPVEAPERRPVAITFIEATSVGDRVRAAYDAVAQRAYTLFERRGRVEGHDLEHWFEAESMLYMPIGVEISRTGEALTVVAWMAAFHANNVEVSVCDRALLIAGRSEERAGHTASEESDALASETEYLEALHLVELSDEIDASRATATLEKGVLTVTLPIVR
jgi:HSP20 family protein